MNESSSVFSNALHAAQAQLREKQRAIDRLKTALEEIADHRFQHPWAKCQQIAMEALMKPAAPTIGTEHPLGNEDLRRLAECDWCEIEEANQMASELLTTRKELASAIAERDKAVELLREYRFASKQHDHYCASGGPEFQCATCKKLDASGLLERQNISPTPASDPDERVALESEVLKLRQQCLRESNMIADLRDERDSASGLKGGD